MKPYAEMTAEELRHELDELKKEYKKVQAMDIQLNMSRGIPCIDQLDLSMGMMDVLDSSSDLVQTAGGQVPLPGSRIRPALRHHGILRHQNDPRADDSHRAGYGHR